MKDTAKESKIMRVSRQDRWVDLKLDVGEGSAEATVDYETWLAIAPVFLDCASDDLGAVLQTIHDEEHVELPADDDIISLFWLTTTLEGTTALAPVGEIARAWTMLPVEPWIGSNIEKWCNRVVHAQVLSAVRPHQAVLDDEVPSWLPRLADASDRQWIRHDENLYWTCASTALGSSCIAWLSDQYEVLGACLAISGCDVSFDRVDDQGFALATAAIELLIGTLGKLAKNAEFAEDVSWSATRHEELEIFETLDRWKKRLQEASVQPA